MQPASCELLVLVESLRPQRPPERAKIADTLRSIATMIRQACAGLAEHGHAFSACAIEEVRYGAAARSFASSVTSLVPSACDVDEAKLAAAKKQGAKLTLDTRVPDVAQKLAQLAMGNLAGAIDFVGMPATAMLGTGALRKGGRYVICGLYGGELVHPLPPIAQRAIGIVGSYVGNLQELKEVVALAKKKKLKSTPVELRRPEEVNRTLDELKAGKVLGRVVLDFGAMV